MRAPAMECNATQYAVAHSCVVHSPLSNQSYAWQGYVKRGLMNSKQVRIEGKIYDVKGTFL